LGGFLTLFVRFFRRKILLSNIFLTRCILM